MFMLGVRGSPSEVDPFHRRREFDGVLLQLSEAY